MTGRRALLLAFLLAAACMSVRAQVGPFTFTPTTLPVGGGVFVVGQTIPPQQFNVSPPLDEEFAWSLSSGNLPPGLTLDPNYGVIQGTPTKGGTFTFTVFCQEVSTTFTASQQFTLYVSSGTLTLTPVTHAQAAAGVFYLSQTFQVGGGVPGYTWSLQNGAIVNGLVINTSSGILWGTPVTGGVSTIGITVTDASGAQISANFTLNVLGIDTTSLSNGTVGLPYSGGLVADGASGTLTWAVTSTVLPPPGITLSPQGLFSGTPTTSGTFPFVVRVTDSATNLSSSSTLRLTVLGTLTITNTSLPGGTVGTAYSQTLAATGSTNPLTWSLSGTAPLPPGLNISAQGVIGGKPTQAGTFPFQAVVTDPILQMSATQTLSIAIAAATTTTTISPATLPNDFVNLPYPATTLTVPGVTISNWAVTAGTLPAGLNLNASTGVLSGTPTAAGNSTFTISATPAAVTAVLPPVMQSFTIAITTATISGFPAIGAAASQSSATVALTGGTYPLLINGTMTLTFAPASGGAQNYDAKFGTGTGTTVNFTIPAGSAQGLFGTANSVPLMVGTVAGTITITTVVQDSTGNTLTPPAPITITVSPTAPVITKGAFSSANGAFSISVTGYSPTRDMTSALFHFTPTSTGLTSTDITVALTSAFTAWYGSSTSTGFGSQFTMTVPFTFNGPPGTTVPCISLTVTLTNSKGASSPFGIGCQPVVPVP